MKMWSGKSSNWGQRQVMKITKTNQQDGPDVQKAKEDYTPLIGL